MTNKFEIPHKVSQALDSVLSIPNPRISYELFRNKYLALFNPLAWPNKDAPLRDWLEIAGTEFQVVDCYKGDEFMFEIPPLLNREGVGIGKDEGYRIQSEILRSIEEENRMAPLGDAYVRSNIVPHVVTPDTDVATVKQWEMIFQHFGITKFPDEEGNPAIKVDGVKTGSDEDVKYNEGQPFADSFEDF